MLGWNKPDRSLCIPYDAQVFWKEQISPLKAFKKSTKKSESKPPRKGFKVSVLRSWVLASRAGLGCTWIRRVSWLLWTVGLDKVPVIWCRNSELHGTPWVMSRDMFEYIPKWLSRYQVVKIPQIYNIHVMTNLYQRWWFQSLNNISQPMREKNISGVLPTPSYDSQRHRWTHHWPSYFRVISLYFWSFPTRKFHKQGL